MKKLWDDASGIFKGWILNEEKVFMELSHGVRSISATDIVRVEFKGQLSVNDISINVKPSEMLTYLHFNRFPCVLKIKLKMPADSIHRPLVEFLLSYGKNSYLIKTIPDSDQIIINGKEWFPLISDNIQEIKQLLLETKISNSGIITLKQAMDLIKMESSLILVSFDSEALIDPNVEKNSFDQKINLLANNSFRAELYPYQKTGFSWLISISNEGLGCVLADEMGLGKTLQIIATLTYFRIEWKKVSLIIAPATLLENWRREFMRFSPQISVLVHSGQERSGFPSNLKKFDVVICSYDTAVRDQGLLGMLEWGFVVLDEAQAIKNSETRRAIAVKGLKRKISIAVTGTPVENRLADLWSIMDFSCSGLLGTRDIFEKKYGDDYQSAQKLEKIVSPLMLRRRVEDVANDLPEKIIIPQPVNMSDFEVNKYEEIRKQVEDEYGKSATLISLLRLRQFCTHPSLLEPKAEMKEFFLLESSKYCRLIEILEEIVLNSEKVIVFTSFIYMSDMLFADIPKRFNIPAWQIDGRTLVESRQKIIDQFSQVTGSAILLLNPKAAGTGLNITAANHVIHYTLEWNPAIEDQATARAFRRGQTLPVTVHRLFYPNTVEEVINDRLNRKRELAKAAVVGTEAKELETADISRALRLSPLRT